MEGQVVGSAAVSTPKSFWQGAAGRWAGEQLTKAALTGELSPSVLRTNDVLSQREWIAVDEALVSEAAIKLTAVADLIAAGLTIPITNAMGKTVIEYEKMGDMDPATVSMDGMTRSENDAMEVGFAYVPLPITHKDFFINLRKLAASRNRGESLDLTQSRTAGRLVAEEVERMLFQGGPTFATYPIYGYTTHPDRNIVAFGANGNWVQAAKTGENILTDVLSMVSALEADRMSGPYWLYISRNASTKLANDFKANGTISTLARLREVAGITRIEIVDQLPANNIVMVQATSDVVVLANGESLQTVQWDVGGGFGVNFKAFAIQVPIIRSDKTGRSGIAHMS